MGQLYFPNGTSLPKKVLGYSLPSGVYGASKHVKNTIFEFITQQMTSYDIGRKRSVDNYTD